MTLIEFLIQILAGIIVGVTSGIISLYIFYTYLLPGLTKTMTKNLLSDLKKDEEFKPLIAKGAEIINRLEPIMKELRTLDINGIQKDLRPLLEIAKKVNAEKIDGLIDSIKDIIDHFKKSIEKPNIPSPPPVNN